MALSIDDLIKLVDTRGKNTAVDPDVMAEYEQDKFLKDQEARRNAKIAVAAGIPASAVEGMSRRDIIDLTEKARTAAYDKKFAAREKTYGTAEPDLIKEIEGKAQFRSPEEQRRMAFSDPDTLASEADQVEKLFFPRGRAYSDRPNAKEIAGNLDDLRHMIESGPKSADVVAQRAAAKLPDFEKLTSDEADEKLRKGLESGEISSGEAATIRTALKPKAALEEEEMIARMRPEAEARARETDTFHAADELLAPLSDATKLTIPEVRARKRLAVEIQKRGVDPMNVQGMRNPRALPAIQRTHNPASPATLVNPDGDVPNEKDLADQDFEQMMNAPGPVSPFPVVPSPYDLATQSRKKRLNDTSLDDMFL